MKTNFRAVGALMLSLSLCGGLLTMAQAAPKDGTAKADKGKRGEGKRGGMRMMQELNLTDAQKQQLMPVMKATREQMKSLRDDTSLSPEAKKAKLKDLRESSQVKIKAILTPEQQTKMAEMRKKARAEGGQGKRGEGKRGGKGGAEAPVPAT